MKARRKEGELPIDTTTSHYKNVVSKRPIPVEVRIQELEEQVAKLAAQIKLLNGRTTGLIRVGGGRRYR